VSLKKNLPACNLSACDISDPALVVARKNAEFNQTAIHFFSLNILEEKISDKLPAAAFEVIVSNPPYIKESEKTRMENNVLEHEPHLALFVKGNDAILFYRKIVDVCAESLQSGGSLYFELNPLTAAEVEAYAQETKLFSTTRLIKDMSGHVRFFKGIKH
jgi:release factor glutamine methyltransferase